MIRAPIRSPSLRSIWLWILILTQDNQVVFGGKKATTPIALFRYLHAKVNHPCHRDDNEDYEDDAEQPELIGRVCHAAHLPL